MTANSLTLLGTGGNSGSLNLADYCTGVGDETTKLQNLVNTCISQKKVLNGTAMTITTSGTIDMRANNLLVNGNGMQINRLNELGPVLMVGGTSQRINGIFTTYHSGGTQATASTANGIEFYNGFQSVYDSLESDLAYNSFHLGQSGWNASPTNTLFSCTMTNLFANGWSNLAMDMETWPAGSASSTGNVWGNLYFHNNYFGSPANTPGYVVMIDHDESSIVQMNCEWGIPTGDLIFMQRCRNMVWNSQHFEGIQLGIAGTDVALMRAYENCVNTIAGLTFTNSTINNIATGQNSIFRCQQISGSPMDWDISGVRVRSITNAGTKPLAAIQIESAGAGNARVDIRDFETASLTGGNIIGDASATQVKRFNADYRGGLATTRPTVTGAKGSNAALGSLMTALSGVGLVTDTTTA